MEPTYSDLARAEHIDGAVVLAVVINEKGKTQDIEVVSPLGFGLDERAIEAVKQWTFEPGKRNGQPVKVRATIQVNFHLLNKKDDPHEGQRTLFNLSLHNLTIENRHQEAIAAIAKLAEENYPPAMHYYGVMLRDGTEVPTNPDRAERLMDAAFKQKYPPAMFEIGLARLRSGDDKARKILEEASDRGSVEAAYYLGMAKESGLDGFPQDANKALDHFLLCAAKKQKLCQFGAGRLLLNRKRRDVDLIQGVAWLELAAAQGVDIVAALRPVIAEVTPEKRKDIDRFKTMVSK